MIREDSEDVIVLLSVESFEFGEGCVEDCFCSRGLFMSGLESREGERRKHRRGKGEERGGKEKVVRKRENVIRRIVAIQIN